MTSYSRCLACGVVLLLLLMGSRVAHAQEATSSACAAMTAQAPFADLAPEQVLAIYNSLTPEDRKAVYPSEQAMPELSPEEVRLLRQRLAAGAQRLVREDRNLRRRASTAPRTELFIRIDAEGAVSNVLIRESSGFESVDELAVRSLREARFRPSRLADCPQPVWVLFPLALQVR